MKKLLVLVFAIALALVPGGAGLAQGRICHKISVSVNGQPVVNQDTCNHVPQ